MHPLPNISGTFRCVRCGTTRKEEDTRLRIGGVIGNKYRLLSRLNAGGNGDVYFCHPLQNPAIRHVVKILRDPNSALSRKRFEREAELLSTIKSDNIVKIFDYWSDRLGNFIVLEYIEGKNLSDYRRLTEFDEEAALVVAKEVAKTLQLTWEKYHIIHRDIKPSNIMLDQKNHVKLLDFGISKVVDAQDSILTLENKGLGTPGFMSPEQFNDSKNASFRSDIFSLGATIYFLLTGQVPFTGTTLAELYENTLHHSPPLLEKFQPEISAPCKKLVRKMMEPAPQNRPDSWSEVVDQLRAMLK